MRTRLVVTARARVAALFAVPVALLALAPAAGAAWTAVPPAYTGNESAQLSYDGLGTLTELDQDAGLPGNVYHGRSRPAGGAFGGDFELPFLLPLAATRPDGTEALVGMTSARDVQTALRPDAGTAFALTDEHSTSGVIPPAGVSVSSAGNGLAEWVDSTGHVRVAELGASASAFGPAVAALPGDPAQQITFLSVVDPVVDPSGAAVLTWAASADGTHYQLMQSTRPSALAAFGAPTAVGPDIEVEPRFASNASGVAAAVWWNQAAGKLEAAIRQPGGAFGGAQTIATPTGVYEPNALQVAVTGDGTVVVLWRNYATPPASTCPDGNTGTTLHLATLARGGSWGTQSTGSSEVGAVGYSGPVLAVSQSTFAVADVLAEGQGNATCGSGPRRIYGWQGAPGTFDPAAWMLLPDQTTEDSSSVPTIAADPAGDLTVSWLVGSERHEATTGSSASGGGGAGGGGADEGGNSGGSDGGPQRFGPAPPSGRSGTKASLEEAVSVPKVKVVAFNVGLGRPETVEMPISCTSDANCNVMAEAAIRLAWGTLGPQSLTARASAKPKAKTATLRLPKAGLKLAAHASGKLTFTAPKATVKRLEALLRENGAKAKVELTVKLRVNGVAQSHAPSVPLRIKEAKPKR